MTKKIASAVMMATAFALGATARTTDPNVAQAEKMFGFVQADRADSLYAYMADEVRPMINQESLAGVLAQAEASMGKYKSHGAWEVQTVMGTPAYVSTMLFEDGEMSLFIIFNDAGKMLGIQLLPPESIR